MFKTQLVVLTFVLALACASAQAQNLFVPESNNDQVYLISAADGSVIDASFIDIATPAANAGVSSTPIEVLEVGNNIWISDQVADRIWKFDRNGSFLGDIGVGEFNNIRGMEVVGNTVYVSMGSSSNTQPEGIITVDATTEMITGNFASGDAADISYYDVLHYNGELLVSNIDSGNDALERFALDGTFLGNFATSDGTSSFDFAQQMNARGSNGNLLVGGFSPPSGVYEFMPDGTSLGIVAGLDFGPRGAYELGNGDVLWTNGSFLATDNNTIVDGFSFRFISPTTVPEPTSLGLLIGIALLVARRK